MHKSAVKIQQKELLQRRRKKLAIDFISNLNVLQVIRTIDTHVNFSFQI